MFRLSDGLPTCSGNPRIYDFSESNFEQNARFVESNDLKSARRFFEVWIFLARYELKLSSRSEAEKKG